MHKTVQYCAARFVRKSCKWFSIGPLPRDWIQSPTSRLDSPQSWMNCRRTCLVSVENKTTTFLKMQDASKFGSWAISSFLGSSQILQVEAWHSYTATPWGALVESLSTSFTRAAGTFPSSGTGCSMRHRTVNCHKSCCVHKCVLIYVGLSPLPGFQSPPGLWTIFSRESRTKPSFATVTGRGDNPIYMYYVSIHV